MKKILAKVCLMLICFVFILALGLVGGYEVGRMNFGELVVRLVLCGVVMFGLTRLCDFLDR